MTTESAPGYAIIISINKQSDVKLQELNKKYILRWWCGGGDESTEVEEQQCCSKQVSVMNEGVSQGTWGTRRCGGAAVLLFSRRKVEEDEQGWSRRRFGKRKRPMLLSSL